MPEFYCKNDGIQDILVAEMQQKILIIDIYKCDDILFYILHVIISLLVVFQHEDNSTIYQIFNQHIKLENTGIYGLPISLSHFILLKFPLFYKFILKWYFNAIRCDISPGCI